MVQEPGTREDVSSVGAAAGVEGAARDNQPAASGPIKAALRLLFAPLVGKGRTGKVQRDGEAALAGLTNGSRLAAGIDGCNAKQRLGNWR